jgi:carbon monoxide dehydrogenase subunit G
MNILYRIGATVAGLLAAASVVGLVEWVNGRIHPMPAGLQVDDLEAMKTWVAGLPTSAFLMLLVAWGAGSFVGAFVARRIATGRSVWPATIVCLLLTLATISNLMMLPHPWWLWPAGIAACLIFGLAGIVMAAPSEYLVSATRVIHAPMENVFQTLARAENYSKAVPGITNIEFLTDKHYGVGTRFRETRLMHGKEAATELEVTELDENRRIRMIAEAGGTIWDTVFSLNPHENKGDDSQTHTHLQMAARPQNLAAKVLTPMILGMVFKGVESDMDAVKRYCES